MSTTASECRINSKTTDNFDSSQQTAAAVSSQQIQLLRGNPHFQQMHLAIWLYGLGMSQRLGHLQRDMQIVCRTLFSLVSFCSCTYALSFYGSLSEFSLPTSPLQCHRRLSRLFRAYANEQEHQQKLRFLFNWSLFFQRWLKVRLEPWTSLKEEALGIAGATFFIGQMPFLSPDQQCQRTEGITIANK